MKYVITSKWQTAAPQYQIRFGDWNLKPQIRNDQFAFTPPPGAVSLENLVVDELGGLATFAAVTQHVVRAASVASLSLGRFSGGKPDDVAMLVPHYIRKSDAEMNIPKK